MFLAKTLFIAGIWCEGMNMSRISYAVWIFASLSLLACSCGNEPTHVSTLGTVSSSSDGDDDQHGDDENDDDDDEHDEDDGFRAARVARGFAIAPVPLATRGSRQERDRIGYGSYLLNAVSACRDCHSTQGHLSGGRVFNLGSRGLVYARNLTPDRATGMRLTEAQFIETMRTGKDFRPGATQQLAVMPWPVLRWASKGDLKAIYAYLRAIPPVVNAIPSDTRVGFPPPVPFRAVYNVGDVVRRLPEDTNSIQANVNRGLAISPLVNPRHLGREQHRYGRGSYLVNSISDCSSCHTNPPADPITFRLSTETFLSGGRVFLAPPRIHRLLHESRAFSANMTGQHHGFFHEPGSTFERFERIIRSGTHADETPPRPLAFPMPWDLLKEMVAEDLHSIFTYLTLLPARTGAADKEIQDYTRWCEEASDCRSDETCYANPATGANECVGGACADDQDCSTCQTCEAGTCIAPGAGDSCLASGI